MADEPTVGPEPGAPTAVVGERPEARLLARIEERTAKVVVVGQGYVGLPVAMRASEVGFRVVGLELSGARVASLRSGRSYVSDVAADELGQALARGYLPTDDPNDAAGFDVAVVTVPTPLREGTPDLSHVESAVAQLADLLQPGAMVVLESTTYPGTTDELVVPILERSGLRAGEQFFVGYSPERIDPGNPRFGLVNTPKVVAGQGPVAARCVEAFYGALVDKVVPVGSPAEAELVKLLENTFRHVNIALVNELAMFAADLGIDIWNAIDAASSKPFGYMRFTPGPGVGGHCLPVDPSYLSWQVKRRLGLTFRFVELANDVNQHMPDYVMRRAVVMLNRNGKAMSTSRVLVLGLAYKAATSDWRESPSLVVVERLRAMGADVVACEPYLPDAGGPEVPVPVVACSADELARADLVVLMVDHPDFSADLIAEHSRLLLDTKGVVRHLDFAGETL